jgi:hypothetical protein
LLINKFTLENNCLVNFSSSGFFIHDLTTRMVVGIGRCKNKLYVFYCGHASFFYLVFFTCNLRASSITSHA